MGSRAKTETPQTVWLRRGVCERCGKIYDRVAFARADYSVTGVIAICMGCLHEVVRLVKGN